MKTLHTVLASVLSYTLVMTPAFGQSDDSGTTESEATEVAPNTTEQPPAENADQLKPEKEEMKRKRVVDEPGAPSRGTGKIVGGIVTTSVGAGLGIITLAFASIDCNDINEDEKNSSDIGKQKERENDIKDCKNGQKDAKVTGAVLLAAGLGVGLPLLYFGIQDRKVYNEWKAGQPVQDESAYAPGKASLVLIPNGNSISTGINVSYNF